MEKEPRLREASFELWAAWDAEFSRLLQNRTNPDFPEWVKAHIYNLATMTEQAYPQEVAMNRSLWVNFIQQVLQAEIDSGEQGFAIWAAKLAENLRGIAADVPKAQKNWDSNLYCQP